MVTEPERLLFAFVVGFVLVVAIGAAFIIIGSAVGPHR